jgi:hypothetical protein
VEKYEGKNLAILHLYVYCKVKFLLKKKKLTSYPRDRTVVRSKAPVIRIKLPLKNVKHL